MSHPIDKDRQLSDILVAAEAFRVAMIESGAAHKVSQDLYFEQLRALERTMQPLNYIIPPEMIPPAVEHDIAITVTMLCPQETVRSRSSAAKRRPWVGQAQHTIAPASAPIEATRTG